MRKCLKIPLSPGEYGLLAPLLFLLRAEAVTPRPNPRPGGGGGGGGRGGCWDPPPGTLLSGAAGMEPAAAAAAAAAAEVERWTSSTVSHFLRWPAIFLVGRKCAHCAARRVQR